jgi:hypothetical protein
LIGIVPEESLYLACEREKYDEPLGMKVHYTTFSVLPNTYMLKEKKFHLPVTSLDEMFAYLDNTDNLPPHIPEVPKRNGKQRTKFTVRDNVYEQLLFNPEQ